VPDSAIALAILIWFLPLSFFNGLTQYVLIAIGRQARITLAFVFAAVFNVGANLLLIPRYGYVAAAVVTILSEVVLLVPFLFALRGRVRAGPVLLAALRPVPAAAVLAVLLLLGWDAGQPWRLLLAAAATAAYLPLLLVSGVFDPGERRLLQGLLPARLRGLLPAG